MHRQTTQLLILFLIGAIVAVVGCYVFFIKIRSANEHIFALSQELAAREADSARLTSIEASIDQTKLDIEKVQSYFIAPDGVVKFIEMIETLAKESNVTSPSGIITSVNIEKTGEENDYKETLHLSVTASGTWNNVFYFLSLVENIAYKIDLGRVSLSKVDSASLPKGSGAQWRLDFDFKVLKLK